jgi:lipoate-protein ligase A
MYLVGNDGNDPRYNLALEEYLFRNFDIPGGCLMLWRNKPSVIVGRYQNTFEEVNQEYVVGHGVEVVRRITGGGAVYHDLGNVNFSFIDTTASPTIDFAAYNRKIMAALARLGITTELNSRNDIVIDGKKFSGNAQVIHRGRILHHGTLLYDADLENVGKALAADPVKYESKSIKSVRSRVANISDYLSRKVAVEEFMGILLDALYNGASPQEYVLSAADRENVARLRDEKYARREWNYGAAPPFNLKLTRYFSWGKVDMRLEINKGLIDNIKVYGDFFGIEDIASFEEKLRGVEYEAQAVERKLAPMPLAGYFGPAAPGEILSCFFA